MNEVYDVVVVGGGAAGLGGALALGRARRSVLVVDAGEPRNAPAGHVHNYLARDGITPGELSSTGRQEVERYGVRVRPGRARTATRQADGTFLVELEEAGAVLARRMLVTTGLVDELPSLPGIAQGWGTTVLHCPYCHGWEVRDEPLGVLGAGPLAVHQVLLWRQWSDDVVLFRHHAPDVGLAEAEQLAARGVRVVEGEVAAWEGDTVRMADGDRVPRRALVVAAPVRARAEILLSLGVATTDVVMGGVVVGTCVETDAGGLTAVPGVWAAGNVTDPRAQVVTAAAAGLTAGAAINADLIAEDTRHAVERHRFFGQAAWEQRYTARESVWSGNPNPVLVTETADLPPGTALDVGCGEGADAIWLAVRGWQVTGTDISATALARAATAATSRGLDVDWRHVDLLAEPPAPEAYDLVTAQFMHLPPDDRARLHRRLAEAVRPGGTLLVVGHHPSDLDVVPRPDPYDMFFTAEEVADRLDPQTWTVLRAEARPRQVHLDGRDLTLHDAVLLARKLNRQPPRWTNPTGTPDGR